MTMDLWTPAGATYRGVASAGLNAEQAVRLSLTHLS